MSQPTRRTFLEQALLASAAAAATSSLPGVLRAATRRPGANDIIRVGVMGVRGRGRGHVGNFKDSPDAEVIAICDADEGVIAPAMKAVPSAKYYRDIRKMLDNPDIDAISIAAPNHWHSLATIWALQAGKHVYVEKPISHDIYEGRQVVRAAKKYGKVVQHGTQSRSSKATRDAIAWMHEGGLGKVSLAHGLCFKRRESIGKVAGPQQPPSTLDYELWTGPARLEPLQRQNLHYDWHWVFNTGNGDLGNQGVHQMDIARWGLGRNHHPRSVVSVGGRVGYDDDGNTPNSMLSLYDYGDQQILFEVRGLQTGKHMGADIGVIFHGEQGYLVSASYDKVQAFDHDGALLRTFQGGGNHFQVFLDAIKNDAPEAVHASALDGHLSASLCHMGNISYLGGQPRKLAATEGAFAANPLLHDAWRSFGSHLEANGVSAEAELRAGPLYRIDARSESLHHEGGEVSAALVKADYRAPFQVPDQV